MLVQYPIASDELLVPLPAAQHAGPVAAEVVCDGVVGDAHVFDAGDWCAGCGIVGCRMMDEGMCWAMCWVMCYYI